LGFSIDLHHCPYDTLKQLSKCVIMILKPRLEVTQGHSEWHYSIDLNRLHSSSYSSSIVTMAVSCTITEIFSMEYWRDLEIQVRGRSRSLKIVLIDRSFNTYPWPAIVTIALSCIIFKLPVFDVQNIVVLKSRLRSLKITGNGTIR